MAFCLGSGVCGDNRIMFHAKGEQFFGIVPNAVKHDATDGAAGCFGVNGLAP